MRVELNSTRVLFELKVVGFLLGVRVWFLTCPTEAHMLKAQSPRIGSGGAFKRWGLRLERFLSG